MSEVIDLKPGIAKPLQLEELVEEKTYAQQAVDELEAALRKLEGISPAELAFATVPDRDYPRRVNDYFRRIPNRLTKIQIEVHNYLVRVERLKK